MEVNDANLQDLLIASRAAVDRMRNGWPLFAHSLYLPMVQLERALTRVAAASSEAGPPVQPPAAG